VVGFGVPDVGQRSEVGARSICSARSSRSALGKMAEFWDPKVEYDMSDSPWLDIGGVYRGTQACQQLWPEWFAGWEALQFDYELVDAGDRVVVRLGRARDGA
jgi:hypothetical protein